MQAGLRCRVANAINDACLAQVNSDAFHIILFIRFIVFCLLVESILNREESEGAERGVAEH